MLDTDILVDALRRFSAGLDYVEEARQHGALRISITTEMELILGCRNHRELRCLERFLRRCTILSITERIAEFESGDVSHATPAYASHLFGSHHASTSRRCRHPFKRSL